MQLYWSSTNVINVLIGQREDKASQQFAVLLLLLFCGVKLFFNNLKALVVSTPKCQQTNINEPNKRTIERVFTEASITRNRFCASLYHYIRNQEAPFEPKRFEVYSMDVPFSTRCARDFLSFGEKRCIVNTYCGRLPAARLTQSSLRKAFIPVPEYPTAFSGFTLLALRNRQKNVSSSVLLESISGNVQDIFKFVRKYS